MTKHYRALKDGFIWEKGAILKNIVNSGKGYQAISDVWDANDHIDSEYITARIIENSPEWFERVYPIDLLSKTVYKTKTQARDYMSKTVKGE